MMRVRFSPPASSKSLIKQLSGCIDIGNAALAIARLIASNASIDISSS
ncbi:MAG: hypothetical protein HC820_09605 [Hydrococcus sp. RM1_1_31]|nr:hypothetical protein [Hydrococcus sp. RM1_1_31]